MRTLETPRLILRDFTIDDLDDFYEYASVDGVGEMAGWPHHENKETTKTVLDQFINDGDVYAVVLKANNKVIGSLGLHNKTQDNTYPATRYRELGYVLSKSYWGHGYMPEASKAAIKYAFEDLDIEVLWATHFNFNTQSKRVIEKCGFKYHSNGKYSAQLLSKEFEDLCYKITREMYDKMQIK